MNVVRKKKTVASQSDLRDLGARVRHFRRLSGRSIVELCEATGLARSTLYKVESNRMSPTYENLVRLSVGLGVDISQLFGSDASHRGGGAANRAAPPVPLPGRRVIGRASSGRSVETPNYIDTYLCTELSRKRFDPVVTRVKARTMQEFGEFSRHAGEEFTYVLEGSIRMHSEGYEPVTLNAGDYIYFDSQMGHAYLNEGETDALLLTICAADGSSGEVPHG